MKKSEKILMGITIAAVGFWLISTAMSTDDTASSSVDVERLREDYNQRKEQIALAPQIYRNFYELVGQDVVSRSTRPDLDFQEDVAAWCKQYGFNAPNIEKDVENIKEVEDYQLVIVRVTIRDAEYGKVAQLLKDFEGYGLIIQEVDMQSRIDRDLLSSVTISVARLVPHFMDKTRRR